MSICDVQLLLLGPLTNAVCDLLLHMGRAPGRSTEIGHDTVMSQTQAPGRSTVTGYDIAVSQTQAPGRST